MAAMDTLTLAHPVDDKRKASVQTTNFDGGNTSDECIDIRGFANFTVVFPEAVGAAVVVQVSYDNDADNFVPLHSPGVSGAAVSLADGAFAYDVPELAGCHYVRFTTSGSPTKAVKIMGKV